jgi:hypothetical protein
VISFRYHVASLVAVLLALAVGIVLGTGPLEDPGAASALAADRTDGEADARQEAARLRAALAFDDEFAAAAAPSAVAGALRGHAVTLLTLPGASSGDVESLGRLVGKAGGSVAGVVSVRPGLLDPANRQLVDELGAQLAAAAPRGEADAGDDPYARIAALLAYAIGSEDAGGSEVPRQADGVLAGLTTADLLAVPEPVTRRGDLVLVVTGGPDGDDDARRGAGAVVAALSTGIDRHTRGVVVAGPAVAGTDRGVVAELRAAPGADGVSTVDSLDRAAGRAAAVLALAEQAGGGAGAYGAVGGTDGAVPVLTAG